jgi:hypothetical protein
MIMQDRARRQSEPLRWGRREKVAVGAVLGCLIAAMIALGAYALSSGSRARNDCIDVTFASTVGGATLHACGARARAICAAPAGYKGIQVQLKASCRRASFAFGVRG